MEVLPVVFIPTCRRIPGWLRPFRISAEVRQEIEILLHRNAVAGEQPCDRGTSRDAEVLRHNLGGYDQSQVTGRDVANDAARGAGR